MTPLAPTRRLVAIVVAAGIALLFVTPDLVVAALSVVIGLAAADYLLVRRMPTAIGDIPTTLSRRVPASVTVDVDPARSSTVLRVPAPPDVEIRPVSQRGRVSATITAHRRGHHRLSPTSVRLTGPLGLVHTYGSVGEETAIAVMPDMHTARRLAADLRSGRIASEASAALGDLGLGTAFEKVREYSQGDDVRRINWFATARHGRPLVNEYRIEQDRDVVCLVDMGRLMSAPLGRATRLDLAVDGVAAIAAAADVIGDRVGVLAFDGSIRRQLDPRRRAGETVARTVYDLEPSTEQSDYRRAFERIAGRKRSLVVIFTDLFEPAAAQPLADAIPILSRRHAVVVATVEDPDIIAALDVEASPSRRVASAVVAVDLLETLDATIAGLRRYGAVVVKAPPEHFPAACVRAYVRTKSLVRF